MRLNRQRLLGLQLVSCFAAGILSCALMNFISPGTAVAPVQHVTPSQSRPAVQESSSCAVDLDAGVDASPCDCAGNITALGRTPAEMAQWQQTLEQRAVNCDDDVVKRRMGIAMMSNVLGQCALKWLAAHADEHLHPKQPQVLFDYTYDAMDYPFSDSKYRDWLQLLSFLPQDSLAMPERKGAAPNQILLGTPILYRLKSFFATSTFIDVQLALRFDEMATYATPIDPLELIAKMVSMGRTTYLVLSCTPFSDMTDVDAVHQALRQFSFPSAPLGIHHLEATVEILEVFRYRTCTKPLLKVTLRQMEKIGRAKWCYYPTRHFGRFRLSYAGGELEVTDQNNGQQVAIKHASGLPYVPMSEILGWGVVRDTREYWFGYLASHKVCESMEMHNVVMLAGGTLSCHPSPFLLDDVITHPTGKYFLAYLQLLTCTGHGQKWRVQYGRNSTELAYYTTQGANELRFSGDTLYRSSHGTWKPAMTLEQQAAQFQDDSGKPICGTECLQCFSNFTSIDTPAAECVECYECLAKKKQHHFLAQSFVGCNNVDGISENGVPSAHTNRCFDTQKEPMPRPTAPQGFL